MNDSRIFFTLKNDIVLQCVLKYLDVVGKIQFLTFLKLNRGWSYKNNIITVGRIEYSFSFCRIFFHPKPNKTNLSQKMWIFTQIVTFPLNLFKPMVLKYIFDKNSKQWYVKKWGIVRAGSPTRARPLVLLITFDIGPSQDSSYYSALQNVFFNCDFLSYHF